MSRRAQRSGRFDGGVTRGVLWLVARVRAVCLGLRRVVWSGDAAAAALVLLALAGFALMDVGAVDTALGQREALGRRTAERSARVSDARESETRAER